MHLAEKAPDNEWPAYNDTLSKIAKPIYEKLNVNDPLRKKFAEYVAYNYSNFAFLAQFEGKYDESINFLFEGVKLNTFCGNKKGLTSNYISLGAMNQRKNDLIKAMEYYEKAALLAKEINDPKTQIECNNNIGGVLKQQGNMAEAIRYYEEGLSIAEKNQLKDGTASSLYNLAGMYKNNGDIQKAKDYALRSLKLREEINNRFDISYSLNFIGLFYQEEKDYKTALEYFEKSLKIREELGDKRSIGMSYITLGDCSYGMNDLEKALEYYKKAKDLNDQIGDKDGSARALLCISKAYLAKKDLAKAVENASKAFEISEKIKYVLLQRDAALQLYKVYKIKGEYTKSLEFHEKYIELKEKINTEESKKALISSEFRIAYEKKEQALKLEQEKKNIIHQQEALRKQSDLDKQKAITYGFMAGFILLIALVFMVLRNLKQTKAANAIISEQKKEVEGKNVLIESKQKEIVDSINYALRIQEAILPARHIKENIFEDSFIFFKQKDIVSGDFYWYNIKDNKRIITAVDCTGHGVPGALMSMLGMTFLNEIVNHMGITTPAKILTELRDLVKVTLKQSGSEGESKDGMDMALICVDPDTLKLEFCGANNPLWILRTENGITTVVEIEPDKRPVGYFRGLGIPFTNKEFQLQKGDRIYLFTDGYADQFGGPRGKKFKYKQLQQLLLSIVQKPMHEQNQIISERFELWKGSLEQVDDVCVIGVRI
jgi:serine phosphatase RsbU (regulator of sigma subunit)